MKRPAPSMRCQRGVALFTAIFLIAVIAVVGLVFILTSVTQQLASARALEVERAYYVGRGCLDAAVADARAVGNCPTLRSGCEDGFTVTLDCSATPVSEGGSSYNVFTLTVEAARGDRAAATLSRRLVRAQVTDLDEG